MDKQTLSNYGWLVIVTLILAVMLALATPFGTYVGDAVVSIANGYVQASNNAIDEDNIQANGEKWDSKFDHSAFDEKSKPGITYTDGTFMDWNAVTENYENISNTRIDEYAFCDETSFAKVVLPDTITYIDAYAFGACENLTEVILPNSITVLSQGLFIECYKLQTVSIPVSVTEIQSYVFDSTDLKTINYAGTKAQWNSIDIFMDAFVGLDLVTVHCADGDLIQTSSY